MEEAVTDALEQVSATLGVDRQALARALQRYPVEVWKAELAAADPFLGYRHIPPALRRGVAELQAEMGREGVSAYLRLIMVGMIEKFDGLFATSGLDECFIPEFEHNFARIRKGLQSTRIVHLEDDVFLKDLGIVCLRLIPCVSHLMYRHSGIPRRALLRTRGMTGRVRMLYTLAKLGGFAPLIENHVHPAMLDRFNEAGRERCLMLVSTLLAAWPDSLGLMGSSWYYDPAVGGISPKLAYLHDGPAARGASFFDMGASEAARQDAVVRSPHRRRLVTSGQYNPHIFMMIWSRRAIQHHYPPQLPAPRSDPSRRDAAGNDEA